jgi:hypothetical protein
VRADYTEGRMIFAAFVVLMVLFVVVFIGDGYDTTYKY